MMHKRARYRLLWPAIGLLLLVGLAGCGGLAPGPVATSPDAPATVEEIAPPTTPTAPALMPVPTSTPTSAPTPTSPALPTPTPAQVAPTPAPTVEVAAETGMYQVAFVASGDVLNVRDGPGPDYEIVGELPPGTEDVRLADEGQELLPDSTWVTIEAGDVTGWANGRFLTEQVDPAVFCADPAAEAIVDALREAIAAQDGEALAGLVHPARGLRVRHSWWNDEFLIEGDQVASLFGDSTSYDWGVNEGSGEPITGSFAEVILPLLLRDLVPATEQGCDEILFGPTAGMTILPDGYEPVRFFSLYRPAPADQEFDWGTWVIGVERWQGGYYLSYLVHYRYEI